MRVYELLEPGFAVLAALAGVLHVAERQVRPGKVEAVDIHHARVELGASQFDGALLVARESAAAKAMSGQTSTTSGLGET
nr:hypothetical protein [Aeromicrobium sp. Leaf350]